MTVTRIAAAAFVISTVVVRPSSTNGPARQRSPVQIEMRNVRLHVLADVILEVAQLRGEMVSTTEGRPPVFDDQRSYVLRLNAAELALDMTSLSNLLNHQVFAYDGAPLEDVSVEVKGARLEQKGRLRKGVTVPFSMTASVSATTDGRLKLHMESMKAMGIPSKGLLGLFGLELDDLVNLKQRRGIEIVDNDIVMAPGEVLPPPRITGRLTHAEIRGNRLVQRFGGAPPAPSLSPPGRGENYIYFSGGDIRFGKLTMSGADLRLIDADPKDAFDFFPARYDAQLVAGYSKNTPRKGLKTFMPDFDDLQRRPSIDLRPR